MESDNESFRCLFFPSKLVIRSWTKWTEKELQTRIKSNGTTNHQAILRCSTIFIAGSGFVKVAAILAEWPSATVNTTQSSIWHPKHHDWNDTIQKHIVGFLSPEYVTEVRDIFPNFPNALRTTLKAALTKLTTSSQHWSFQQLLKSQNFWNWRPT